LSRKILTSAADVRIFVSICDELHRSFEYLNVILDQLAGPYFKAVAS